MELRQLRYLLAVADAGGFTRAAEHAHVSQPSLSQQIRQLEEELGMPLFSRGQSGAALTAAGEVVARAARQVIGRLDEMHQELADLENLRQGSLIIGSLPITGGHLLPPVVAAFRHKYPGVKLQLVEERTPALLAATVAGQTDLSLLTLPLETPELAWEPLLEEELLLAAPASHRLVGAKPASLHELADEPFVLLKKGNGFRTVCDAACLAAGFTPRCAFETDSIETAKSLVAAGLGVTLVPELIADVGEGAHIGADAGRTRPVAAAGGKPVYLRLAPPPTRTVVVAWRRERYRSRAAAMFHQLLREFWGGSARTY